MSNEKMREAFETAIVQVAEKRQYRYMDSVLERDTLGDYATTWVDSAWIGYQIALTQQPESEPVGGLYISRYLGSDSMVNHEFQYFGDLPDGSYQLYTGPQPAAVPGPVTPEQCPFLGEDDYYAEGWNDCRKAMLTAAPSIAEKR